MVAVKVLKSFYDRELKRTHSVGETFTATEARAGDISRQLPGYIETQESADEKPAAKEPTLAELKKLAKERGIKVPANTPKAKLAELLGE